MDTRSTTQKIQDLLEKGLSRGQIAKELNLAKSTVSMQVSRHGLHCQHSSPDASNISEELLRDRASKFVSRKEIAEELGVSESTIRKYLKQYNISILRKPAANGTAICTDCNVLKEESEFYKKASKGLQHTYCKACYTKRIIAKQREFKQKAVSYKGGRCEVCGYCKSLWALDFHHRDPKEKDFNLARMKTRSEELIRAELDKCTLLCANCHREEHERLRMEFIT